MATSKLNSEQFAQLKENAAGIIFVYTSKNGTKTAQHFFGKDFEAKKIEIKDKNDKRQEDEFFRVWKNLLSALWATKDAEMNFREKNDGIRSKFRAGTPSVIIINSDKGNRLKTCHMDESVWAKIGLVPTKKDLERTARDYKQAIHNATKASFETLDFRTEDYLKKKEAEAKEVEMALAKAAIEAGKEEAVPADKQLEKAAA